MPKPSDIETNAPKTPVQMLQVGEPGEQQRLDNFLLGKLKGVPKTLIYRIIRKGEVRVNGKRAKPEQRLIEGDQVRVPPLRLPEKGEVLVPGEGLVKRLKAAILYEDDHLLVLNKPSGLSVHAGSDMKQGIIEVMRSIFPTLEALDLVHRLDKGTSGCLVISKSGKSRQGLTDAFRNREVLKVYHLLVAGCWPRHVKKVNLPLQRLPERSGERKVEVDPQGKSASTQFKVLQDLQSASLLEATPATGRTHQIRVHAAEMGHPLLGEDKYFSASSKNLSKKLKINRLCLHASRLEFKHPITGKLLKIQAQPDSDFNQIVKRLGAKG